MEIVRLIGIVAGRRRVLTLRKDQSVVGSAPGADFVIDDPSVSPRHARIIKTGTDYRLSDLLSTSGTYCNGARVTDPVLLRDGGEIRFGRSTFRVERVDASAVHWGITPPSLLATTTAIREATTGAVAPVPSGRSPGAANKRRKTIKRKKFGPAAAALLTVLLVILGFGAAIYFVTWDRIEDLAEKAGAQSEPSAIASVAAPPYLAANAAPSIAIVAPPLPSTMASPLGTTAYSDAAAEAAWLAPLNYYRAIAGLYPVEADSALSAADAAHAHYLLQTYGDRIFDIGGEVHNEDPKLPGYTEAGTSTAHNSNIGARNRERGIAPPPIVAIEGWLTTPFHRLWQLNPDLQRAGYGEYCDRRQCVEVLDVESDLPPLIAKSKPLKQPVEFPPADAALKMRELESEWPDPLTSCPGYNPPAGLPITLQLGPFVTPKLSAYSLTVRGPATTPLEICGFNADSYANPDKSQAAKVRDVMRSFGAIVIIPRAPLKPGRYTVTITADRIYSWNFAIDS